MMHLSLGIRFLCNRVVATHPADRQRPEWPIHPDRVFLALAAAHFETEGDEEERRALEWLEQHPVEIFCSTADAQDVVTSYVPVNDTSAGNIPAGRKPSVAQIRKGLSLLPENRSRQPRQFPAVWPRDERAYFVWQGEPPAEVIEALHALCRKVTYLGHSSSLAQFWLEERAIEELVAETSDPGLADEQPTMQTGRMHLRPTTDGMGRFRLRVPGPGRLLQLEAVFQRGHRPSTAIAIGYDLAKKTSAPQPSVAGSNFTEDLIVLRQTDGVKLGVQSTQLVLHHLRRTIMDACPVTPLPEWLSGHEENGRPSRRDMGHMALVPLPHVGRKHADGHLLGLAIVLPRDVSGDESAACLRDLLFDEMGWAKPIRLTLGRLGEAVFQLDDGLVYRLTLQPETWTRASRRWATVTPVCLDRHPRGEHYWELVESQIADSCERIGLPRPSAVIATPSPTLVGVPHGRNMPLLTRSSDGRPIRHTHAVIVFDQPVTGPIIVGAGRYRGYGFFRPLTDVRSERR